MLRVALAAVLIVAGLVVAAFALARGGEPQREGEIVLAGLSGPVAVAWPDSGGVAIEAATWADAAAGLGYAHAADDAFAMAWWRQAARGETSAWFGDSARAADLHARRLGFDALARQTYDGLAPAPRALLDGYARGVNAALAQAGVAQSDAFVLLGVVPEPWQPWDALAVERLVAWLATPGPDSSWAAAARASPAVARFVRDDAAFRRTLGVYGTAHARAFAAPAEGGLVAVAHQPGGESALRLWVPVALRVGGRGVAVASVPGTLSLPAGTGQVRRVNPDLAGPAGSPGDGRQTWSVFLTSGLSLEPFAGRPPLPVYSRVVERDGDETLVAASRDAAGLILGSAPRRRTATRPSPAGTAPPDSAAAGPVSTRPEATPPRPAVPADASRSPAGRADSTTALAVPRQWRVRWAGFAVGTDAAAFVALAQGRPPAPFRLLRGDGLLLTGRSVRVLGQPPVQADAFAAGSPAARWATARLDTLAGRGVSPAALADDAYSPWAARRLPPLVRALGRRESVPRALESVTAYLRSWDGAYTPEAIAPTIFEAWLSAHRATTGHLPDPADSLDAALLPYTLRLARAELRDARGTDPAGWRWGALHGGVRTPVLGRLGGAAGRPYRDAPAGPGGHPTALRPGPGRTDGAASGADDTRRAGAPDRGPGPAVWSAWTVAGSGTLFVRGPGPVRASFGPSETVFGVRGVSVAVAAGQPLPRRRLVLAPPSD